MLSKKEQDKTPSKELREKIHACVSSFQKLGIAVKVALQQGREEGFTDKQIGKMIRKEMLKAGLTRQTVNNYLPKSAKAKPRGNPSGRPPEPKFSKNFLLNEPAALPELPPQETMVEEDDVLAKEEHKQQMYAVGNTPIPQPRIVDMQRVTPLELQSASIELDPESDEYDIGHLGNYSRSTLVRIIKWQHKHFQECQNEATSWKSKYRSLKLKYKKATGKDWVD